MNTNQGLTPQDVLERGPNHQDEILAGYQDGFAGYPPPEVSTEWYDWGRRNGANDRAGLSDWEQQELARLIAANRKVSA